ncbi:MAG TPA: hypothetical protein VIU61_04755 [Kofleriaceae bacterium]
MAGCGAPAGAQICASDADCPGGTCHAIGPGVSYCAFADEACESGERFGPQSGGLSNVCVGGVRPDGGVDDDAPIMLVDASTLDAPPGAECFGTGLVRICLAAAPTVALNVTANQTINTDDMGMCTPVVGGTNIDACVLAGSTVTIANGIMLRGTGGRPLVIVAQTTLMIGGTVDVASHRSPAQAGANSNFAQCANGTAATYGGDSGGGGYGGSFGGRGGNGESNDGGNGGVSANASAAPTMLRGGCAGGAGGGTAGSAGRGGGAIYLIAKGALSVLATGRVNASGAGGVGGASGDRGAGGGGSGGMLGLDGVTVSIAAGGAVFANGGAGGEGGGDPGAGNPGGESLAGAAAAGGAGGVVPGGDGGGGSQGATLTGGAAPGNADSQGGGGGAGGGGAGVIKLHGNVTNAGVVSPPAS